MQKENYKGSNKYQDLSELDTGILHTNGWHLVGMQSSYENAVEQANKAKENAGIRKKQSNNEIFYEVWNKSFGI